MFFPFLIFDAIRMFVKLAVIAVDAVFGRFKQRPSQFFQPHVSIIIPAHNEEKIIKRSIESALEVDYPNKEIIVVDDGSTDRTSEIATPYYKRGQINLVRRDVASGSKAGALNYGILFSSGDLIVTVDADTLLERNSLREAVKPLSDPSVSAVSGNIRVLGGENGGNNLLVLLQSYEYLIALELGRRYNSIIGTLLIISGAFGVFWKSLMESLGSYDMDTITEDFDVTLKMRKLGKRLVFAEKAMAWTFVPETWGSWRRQRIRWTLGQVESLWKHRNIFRKMGFDLRFVVAAYDMVIMDMVLLLIRLTWFFTLIHLSLLTISYIVVSMLAAYMVLETVMALTAVFFSPRKEFSKILLTPIVVLFYRPIYAFIRIEAYLKWLLGLGTTW